MTNDKTKLSEIKRPSPVFCNRLAGKEHWIGDVCFKLQALPRTVEMYLQSCARIDKDEAVVLIHRLRLGIVGIAGLCDRDGLEVEPKFDRVIYLHQLFTALAWSTLNGIPTEIQDELSAEITKLSLYQDKEKQAQDFIPRSSDGSAAGEESTATAKD